MSTDADVAVLGSIRASEGIPTTLDELQNSSHSLGGATLCGDNKSLCRHYEGECWIDRPTLRLRKLNSVGPAAGIRQFVTRSGEELSFPILKAP
jgi:hypothetical protein